MKHLIKSLSFVLILLLINGCGSSSTPSSKPEKAKAEPKPRWLVNYPVEADYYTGIGSAAKKQFGAEAQKSAQDLALADIASQITVTITSDIVTTLIERGAMTRDEYMATARSQAVADLEGHELVDSYQDAEYFYAYYRLSKAKYAAVQARKREAAISLATDFYTKAREAKILNNFSESFAAATQAFTPLIPYLNEALKTDIEGQSLILSNEIHGFIVSLLSDITLSPSQPNAKAKLGKPITEKLSIHARSSNGKSIRNLPLRVSFKKGGGELLESINTGGRGFAQLQITSINSADRLQILEATIDLSNLLNDTSDPILKGFISTIPKPTARITLDVTNPSIYLEASEVFNGKSLEQLQIEPRLKNLFIDQGFHFVDSPEQADWQMSLRATVNKGTEFQGMYTAFADVSVNLIDRSSGDEIFKNSLSRQKGIDLSYANAANKALNNAADKLSVIILPQIVESLK